MEKNNLMKFQVIGNSMKDNKWKMLILQATDTGWIQTCEDRSHCNTYVSNELFNDLLEWFKCDFFQYRIFEDHEEATAYLNDRTKISNPL